MIDRTGEVKIWANGEPDNGVNILKYEDIALKSDISGINSGTNTGDETESTILSKLGIESISGENTGDETQEGLLSKLGIPGPYADNSAALADGVPIGGLYYVTTTLVLQVAVAAE